MSVCPAPRKSRKTNYSTVSKMTNTPKTPKYETCEGGTTSDIGGPGNNVTTTVCCPNPGPQGVAGCALKWESAWESGKEYKYESGTPCVTSIVTHNNVTYIAKVTFTADTDTEPGTGASWMDKWDIFMQATGELRWKGTWAEGIDYKKNDIVLAPSSGHAFVCITDHTSQEAKDPIAGEPTPAASGIYWEKMVNMSTWVPQKQKSFIDGLMDGVYDWWQSAPLWEKVLGVAAGIGLAVAGAKILDMMAGDGEKPGENADTRYTGSPGYNGAFTAPTLPVVVSSIMQFAGYTPDQFDVTDLPNKEVHFSLTGGLNSRALLNQLALAYQFDVVPSGGKVKFVMKYQDIVRALSWDDLGHTSLDSTGVTGKVPYTAKRIQGIDLPRSIQFTYYSASLDHNTFTQKAEIHTYDDGQDVTISVPFTMDDEEAMRIAETTLVNSHIEQQEFVFTTDYNNIDLEPGDVISIPVGDGTKTATVRIKEINETEDGVLEFKTSRADYNQLTYTGSPITVTSPPAQTTNQPTTIGFSSALFFEVPAIDASDDTPRFYAAIHGFGKAGWPGAALFKSIDGGNTYAQVANSSATVTMGMVASATPAPVNGYYVWDDVTQISVTLKQGTLTTLSDTAVLNGQNWAMIGQELVGFVNAQLTGPNTYTLSRLLRGRRGTDNRLAGHLANELFVLVDGSITEMAYPKDEINKPAKYKVVTIGSSLDKADAIDVQPTALNMLPWTPAQTKIVKNGNDFVITWIERPRLNNGLQDDRELTHDIDFAGYGISIFGESGMTTIKKSAIEVVTTYTYTEAMQIADFGSVQTHLYASVVQMSTIMGGGHPSVVSF